jgi:2,3-bisphosphoglycerate-independent phosphoglycerate mutase
VHGKGRPAKNAVEGIKRSYAEGDTDEFIKPILIINEKFEPIGQIKNDDAVICFNFRTDRCREITLALTQRDFPEQEMEKKDLYYVTMARYDDTFKNVHVIFEKDNLTNTLGEVLSKAGKTQLRIAETEKYPHVTFFFSGGREKPFEGEKHIMVPSPKVATYDLKPEMSAKEVAQAAVDEMNKTAPDFICLNFANADMVGHTGDYKAILKAVETVDACTKIVVEAGLEKDYSFIIIADHGNADYAINEDGTPNTAHTTNPVPCIFISKGVKEVKNGRLADIAPTILELMGVKQPEEMTGNILVS